MTSPTNVSARLADVRAAFDSVAADYDGPLGNNRVIRWMRSRLWRVVEDTFPAGSRLLDLGCGAGMDAVHLAGAGYRVVATDWSPAMVEQTRRRIAAAGLQSRAEARVLGAHELVLNGHGGSPLDGERFDGIYSDLGALNCVPDLENVASAAAALLNPGGRLVISVIGRYCPWEAVYYIAHSKLRRAAVRGSLDAVPVSLNGRTVWTRYYTPRELARAFDRSFELTWYRGLCIFPPPPYLVRAWERFPALCAAAVRLDDRTGAWPLIRNFGDHFLAVLTKINT